MQRAQFATELARFEPWLAVGERVRTGLRSVARHPEWLVGAAVFLAVARPRALWRWLRRGYLGWQLYRRARAWLARSSAALAPRG